MRDTDAMDDPTEPSRRPDSELLETATLSRRSWFARCFERVGASVLSFRALAAASGVALASRTSTAEAQVDLRAMLPSLSNGQIPGRFLGSGLGGCPTGRAYVVIDAPFRDVMRVLGRFPGYSTLVPTLRSIRVESRTSGLARLRAAGRAPLLGSYDVPLNATIVGRRDGMHHIELRTPSSVTPRMHIRISLMETPSRRRTVLSSEVAFGMSHVPRGMARRAHVNASISTCAAIRRRVLHLRDTEAFPNARFTCPA